MSFDAKAFLKTLPHLPGVYRMFDAEGDLLYVGKARDLKNRVTSYFIGTLPSPRIELMVSQIDRIEITITRSESEALLLENNLIKALQPRYNIVFKDDKSYPYLILTDDPFPRVAFFRGKPATKYFFGPYLGSQNLRDTIVLLQNVFKLRTCENSVFEHRQRPCLMHQIHRCSAPCVGYIDKENYQLDVLAAVKLLTGKQDDLVCSLEENMQKASEALHFEQAARYRDQIAALQFLREKQYVVSQKELDADVLGVVQLDGKHCVNLALIRGGRHIGDTSFFPKNTSDYSVNDVAEAFIAHRYLGELPPPLIVVGGCPTLDTESLSTMLSERAAYAVKVRIPSQGPQRVWVDMAVKNAAFGLSRRCDKREMETHRLESLRKALGLPEGLNRIECFDISHTMGEETVASCVVFDQLSMQKKDYRRFNIHTAKAGDDYAAIGEAVSRRYSRLVKEEAVLPELILIDGGLGQVTVASTILIELGLDHIPVVGVAKGPARKAGFESLIFPDDRAPLELGPDHPGLMLVQEIRDEAHRFALVGHKSRRDKKRIGSRLDEIEGIGPKRRHNLLTRFGGFRGVKGASVDELAKVEGVSPALAKRIYQHLHPE